MTDLWTRVDRQLQIHAPELAANLQPGVSESALTSFEGRIGQRLPDDVREAYLRHDGCRYTDAYDRLGLFGNRQWLPLGEVSEVWQSNREEFDDSDPYFYEEASGHWAHLPVRPWQSPPPQWVSIGRVLGEPSMIHIDLLPGPLGTVGQMVSQNYSSMSSSIFARSLGAYLLYLVEGLESGAIAVNVFPHTTVQFWDRIDGAEFRPPGCVSVFG